MEGVASTSKDKSTGANNPGGPTSATINEQNVDETVTAPPPPTDETITHVCCHGDSEKGRNLVVGVDGTGNQFGRKNTNVVELYSQLEKEEESEQLVWYNSGIGTYVKPSDWPSLSSVLQAIDHTIDTAIAWNFKRTLLAAYRWFAENYRKGDRIFLFGFSRGAFQVRVLAAMIDKVGLIHKGNELQVPFAYQLYCDPDSDEVSTSVTPVGSTAIPEKQTFLRSRFKALFRSKGIAVPSDEYTSMAANFKKTFSRDVKVHFVGAWDTVSSIGIIRGAKMLPHTVNGMKHVCYFRHALALDERRVKFLPEYAYGGSAEQRSYPGQNEHNTTEPAPAKAALTKRADAVVRTRPHTLEVWFAGTHSDIGGGNRANPNMNRSRPPLRWMVYEARALGLRTRLFSRKLKDDERIEVKESLRGIWWNLFEYMPWRRLTYTRRANGKETTSKPHFGHPRKIHDGQKIHTSVYQGLQTNPEGYSPKARLPETVVSAEWRQLPKSWAIDDADDLIRSLVLRFVKENNGKALESIDQIAVSGDGRKAVLFEEILRFLKSEDKEHDIKGDKESMHRLRRTLGNPIKRDAWTYLDNAMDYQRVKLDGHIETVCCVAYSPDGTKIASASWDRTIRLWDALTGTQIGQPLLGHTDDVNCVAFSPDGEHIVSGSDDRTLHIWNAATGKQIGGVLEGHTNLVWSVAFSPDGKRIVSGSVDGTLRIWDAETGKQVGRLLQGHTAAVLSVAYSPDGRSIVSISEARTIRIWDAETQQQSGESLKGHQREVNSVAFSPDGTRIVSGADDETIRLWDFATRKQVGQALIGHIDWVRSVAFSPDGRRVVSGSDDRTVRIWDASAGNQIGDPLWGHSHYVYSVAFSPDGTQVVSGSEDQTVRVWDVSLKLWDVAE